MYAFGNDPAKVARYRAFWNRDEVSRPLTGFSLIGWFPLGEFAACRQWEGRDWLTPEMAAPEAFLDDHLRLLREGEIMDDDLIRGACPAQVAIPWLAGMLGNPLRILPQNVLGAEIRREWDEILNLRLYPEHPWFRQYAAFLDMLVRSAAGRFPVSHSPENGPTDLHAMLRGHTESLIDLADEPERSAELLARMGEIFIAFTRATWERLPLYEGGWFDAQYSLWAPGPIARMQEDAIAVYSPRLYRRFVQPVDRAIARCFPCAFLHLHSTSMFLLDAFLELDEVRCFEINNDAVGPPVAAMVPHFRRVQEAGKPLLIRGSFTPEELRLLTGELSPRGLFLNIMVKHPVETEALRPLCGL